MLNRTGASSYICVGTGDREGSEMKNEPKKNTFRIPGGIIPNVQFKKITQNSKEEIKESIESLKDKLTKHKENLRSLSEGASEFHSIKMQLESTIQKINEKLSKKINELENIEANEKFEKERIANKHFEIQ